MRRAKKNAYNSTPEEWEKGSARREREGKRFYSSGPWPKYRYSPVPGEEYVLYCIDSEGNVPYKIEKYTEGSGDYWNLRGKGDRYVVLDGWSGNPLEFTKTLREAKDFCQDPRNLDLEFMDSSLGTD